MQLVECEDESQRIPEMKTVKLVLSKFLHNSALSQMTNVKADQTINLYNPRQIKFDKNNVLNRFLTWNKASN